MKIFDTKPTSKLFMELLDEMPLDTAIEFSKNVKDLYDTKVTSEAGVYKEYKITRDDLINLSKVYA